MNYKIPELTNCELAFLYKRIKPLVRDFQGQLREIDDTDVDLKETSFLWDPKFVGEPHNDLVVLGEFQCLHTFGYYGLFKPSIAEVLCQIPSDLMGWAQYFEIVAWPGTSEDLQAQHEAVYAGFHISTVRVYRKCAIDNSPTPE